MCFGDPSSLYWEQGIKDGVTGNYHSLLGLRNRSLLIQERDGILRAVRSPASGFQLLARASYHIVLGRSTRFFSNFALSRRSAKGKKADVGPRQSRSSTEVKSCRSIRSVARSRKRRARSRFLLNVSERLCGSETLTCQSRGFAGMASNLPKRDRTAAADLAPHPGRPGYPSAASPTRAR
jgi:hypothetical protein